jgi:hypothetical protein
METAVLPRRPARGSRCTATAAQRFCNVAATLVACATLVNAAPAGATLAVSAPSPALRSSGLGRGVSKLQLGADLKDAAVKLQGVQSDVEAAYANIKAELVAVRDHCAGESSSASSRSQVQESAIVALQEERNVQLEKQAQAEAELQAMKTAMDAKVVSYQSSVAQRANEATSYYTWKDSTAKYTQALQSVVDLMGEKRDQMGEEKSQSLARVQGVMKGMKVDVETKMKDNADKHTDQDANYLTLVNSYRQSLSDTQAAYTSKRIQKETYEITARDAGDERDVRQFINNGEASVMEILTHLCASDSGKIQHTIAEGDASLTGVQSRVTSTAADMNSMPDVSALFQLAEHTGHRNDVTISASPPPRHAKVLQAQQDEMKRMAAQVKARQKNQSQLFVRHHSRPSSRKTLKVHIKPAVPTTLSHGIVNSGVKRNASIARILDASVGHLVTSAVALARQRLGTTLPTTMEDCVAEKQRIASDITNARSAKEEAETQKKLADTEQESLTNQVSMVNDQKTKLSAAEDGFSKKMMPLMTAIGTNSYVNEMNAAIAKVGEVESDVNAYTAQGGGVPPAAAALPTALVNIRRTIGEMRDGVQADLNTLQGIFTGSLMTTYPSVTSGLTNKATELEQKKSEAAKQATTSGNEATKRQAEVDKLNGEWDAVQASCAPLLKGDSR